MNVTLREGDSIFSPRPYVVCVVVRGRTHAVIVLLQKAVIHSLDCTKGCLEAVVRLLVPVSSGQTDFDGRCSAGGHDDGDLEASGE